MKPYLDLLHEIRAHAPRKAQRAVLESSGTRPDVLSLFGRQIRFDLRKGFPLVTTKEMHIPSLVGELLWFLSGSTNNNDLLRRGVRFWTQWADPRTGELGPIYGKQWRRWESGTGEPVDQIQYLVDGIRAVKADPHHPAARRLLLTAWNPADLNRIKGPSACHTLVQFNVTENRLSCQLYQRSADMFLGVPYNIASYALLTHLFARVAGLEVGEFIHTFGDAHIYENHLEAVDEQLKRQPLPLPRLELDDAITSMDDIQSEWIRIVDYHHHPRLKAEVAV
jgi:thymidylate synthase